MSTNRKKSNNISGQMILILILLILCLLIVCAGGFFFYLQSQRAANAGQQAGENARQTATAMAQSIEATVAAAAASGGEPGPLPTVPGGQAGVTGASPVIYLAGRTDITIPPLDQPYTGDGPAIFACRAALVLETFPPGYRTQAGAEIQVRASGRVNFYGGPAEEGYLPDGLANTQSLINAFGGISQYLGPQGSLVGVFLSDDIPTGEPPAPLNFGAPGESEGALGVDFERLTPQLGQVFFIGDGMNSAGRPQIFIAPANATRVFIGLADASDFSGDPSCYSDNTGSYDFTIVGNPPVSPIK